MTPQAPASIASLLSLTRFEVPEFDTPTMTGTLPSTQRRRWRVSSAASSSLSASAESSDEIDAEPSGGVWSEGAPSWTGA